MKKLAFVVCLFTSLASFSQNVEKQKNTMSLGPQDGYYITVEGATVSMLEDTWKEYSKEFGKGKYNKKAKEFVNDKVKVPMVNGVNPITIYTKNEQGKGEATTYFWFDTGNGFANDASSQAAGIQTFIKDYWNIARKKAINEELKTEEKKSKDLAKDLDKLMDKKKDYEKQIDECKKKIAEMEKNIEFNGKDQSTKKMEIQKQSKVVQMVVEKLNAVGKSM